MKLTKQIAQKVLQTVDAGLVKGLGQPEAGKMCVEAAVNFALGLPHGDEPKCVGSAVRSYKIALNDCEWSSNEARAKGLRKIAIAQLGSDAIDQQEFCNLVCLKGVQKILPAIFRLMAEHPECKDREKDLKIALDCESVKTLKEAKAAARNAFEYASAYASEYASAYAHASASASAYASEYASASANAHAYAYALRGYIKEKLGEDYFLNLSAEIALEALIELKSEGCQWLDLCEK